MSYAMPVDFQNISMLRDPPGVSREAGDIREQLKDIRTHTERSVALGWRKMMKDEASEIASECANRNWDGDEAQPITFGAQVMAEKFIDLLPDSVLPPSLTPEGSGTLSFDWIRDRKLIFSVSITGEEAIYAGVFGDEKMHGEVKIRNELPKTIDSILQQYFQKT